MIGAFSQVGQFLVEVIFGLFIYAVLLRFALQWAKADFYNPFCQLIVRVTSPVLKIFRRIIPGFLGLDMAALVLAYFAMFSQIILVLAMQGNLSLISFTTLWFVVLIQLLLKAIWMLIILIFIRSLASWFSQGGYNPLMTALYQITEPLLAKARKTIPPTQSGMDFSPTLVIIILFCLKIFISSLAASFI